LQWPLQFARDKGKSKEPSIQPQWCLQFSHAEAESKSLQLGRGNLFDLAWRRWVGRVSDSIVATPPIQQRWPLRFGRDKVKCSNSATTKLNRKVLDLAIVTYVIQGWQSWFEKCWIWPWQLVRFSPDEGKLESLRLCHGDLYNSATIKSKFWLGHDEVE